MALIHQLQAAAMDQSEDVSSILRKALVVATKLNMPEMRNWINKEMKGYSSDGKDVPDYRIVRGELKAWNPYLQDYIPIRFRNPRIAEALSRRSVTQPTSEIEGNLDNISSDTFFEMPLTAEIIDKVFRNTEQFKIGLTPTVIVPPAQFRRIIETVRNFVLEWALKLEEEGIVGEDMTFSKKEQNTAVSVTNVFHAPVTGNFGDIVAENVNIADRQSNVVQEFGDMPPKVREEISTILDQLQKADGVTRKTLLQRGFAWLEKYGPGIGAAAETIRSLLQ